MRVALTQSVFRTGHEDLDCIEHSWATVLEAWGHLPVPVLGTLRHPERLLTLIDPGVVILTGGVELGEPPDSTVRADQERGERRLVEWCAARQVPVIGICGGMQLLLTMHGGHVREIAGHVERRHVVSVVDTPFTGGGLKEVNSDHRQAIDLREIRPPLVPFAWDVNGNVEAFYREDDYGSLREVGMMWHPERDDLSQWGTLVLNGLLRHLESQERKRNGWNL